MPTTSWASRPRRCAVRPAEYWGGASGRAAARAGRAQELKRIYVGQLELPEAIAEAAQMLELAREKPSALLCFERDPAACHRTLLLKAVAPDAEVVDLFA